MLTIVDKTVSEVKKVTLNEIPVGQLFRGRICQCETVTGELGELGIFYKMSNRYAPWTRHATHSADPRLAAFDVLVIRLDTLDMQTTKLFPWCREVLDYEPLKGTFTIEKE